MPESITFFSSMVVGSFEFRRIKKHARIISYYFTTERGIKQYLRCVKLGRCEDTNTTVQNKQKSNRILTKYMQTDTMILKNKSLIPYSRGQRKEQSNGHVNYSIGVEKRIRNHCT